MPRGKKKEPAKLAEAPGANDDTLAGPVRRSDRARKPVEFYGVVSVPSPAKAAPAKKPRGKATPTKATDDENPEKYVPVGEASAEELDPEPEPSTRRNRKRKAAPGNLEDPTDLPVPDNLLEAALAPWGQNEQDKDWPSWMTLESDPVRASLPHPTSYQTDNQTGVLHLRDPEAWRKRSQDRGLLAI